MRGLFPALLLLFLLPGCATTPGLPGVIALALFLVFASACRPVLQEDRINEFLIRFLLRDDSNSEKGCTATQDYTQSFDLNTVDPATNGIGFTITGQNAGDRFGKSVAGAGDFNGDGIGDVIVSAYYYLTNRGRAYLIYGRAGTGGDIDTATMTSSDGITLTAQTGDYLGRSDSIQSAGDVNGDGYDDLLLGAYEGNGVRGRVYLIFGTPTPTDLDLSTLAATDGVVFQGDPANAYAGMSVAGLGDVNGDGLDDFVIAQRYGSSAGAGNYGEASIIYGKTSGWANTTLNPTNVSGTTGFTVRGEASNAYHDAASRIGDLNGDGLNDILIGAPAANGGVGGAYVIYGVSGTRANIDLFGGPLGSNGFEITGSSSTGRVVAGGGDFNGDGQIDFASGSSTASASVGRVALLYGDVGALNLGTLTSDQGSIIDGISSYRYGQSISMQGDVNGDGLDDLLVGAPNASTTPSFSGSAWLIFGQTGIPTTGANFSSYSNGSSGIRIDGPINNARLGQSVDLSDVNGDGCADIIVGASGTANGTAYVIFGGRTQ